MRRHGTATIKGCIGPDAPSMTNQRRGVDETPNDLMQPSTFQLKLGAMLLTGLCATAAGAAEVQIYGIVDEGLSYIRTDADNGSEANC